MILSVPPNMNTLVAVELICPVSFCGTKILLTAITYSTVSVLGVLLLTFSHPIKVKFVGGIEIHIWCMLPVGSMIITIFTKKNILKTILNR